MNFNIKPSLPDDRDYIYRNDSTEVLRESVDLRECDTLSGSEELIEDTFNKDEMCLRDGLKIIKKLGRISSYHKLISIYYITEVLNYNKPVVFGMEIYDSFMDLNERISTVNFPGRKERSVGGHAMCMVGYDMRKRLFLAKNSFATTWGDNGYCWIPFDYIRQEGYDIWTFDISNQAGEPNVLPQTIPLLPSQKILL
jgi:C1A family cysteine protease